MTKIEIKGTGSHNKGAEMMLLTIVEQLKSETIKFTIAPQLGSCEYPFYSRLGLYPKVWFRYKGIQFGKFGKFIPKKLRDLYGMVIDEEIDMILDASGFAYSSQWGDYPTKIMAEESKKWNQMGKKVVLMPQAFGPFENDSIKSYMKEIIENVTLIYARDSDSCNALKSIKDDDKIKLCPDFTVLFKGIKPDYFDSAKHQVCIVPNQRMKDKTNDSQNYEEFFANIIKKIQSQNLSPFFLIHGGGEDKKLAEKINDLLDQKIELVDEENPYFIKGIIENSIALIGSRFHSLASGLYSGIPTLGTGWSHKYKHLFQEFDFEDGLLNLHISEDEIDNALEFIFDKVKNNDFKRLLINKKKILEQKSVKLFEEIKKLGNFN